MNNTKLVLCYFDRDGDEKILASDLTHRLALMGGKLKINEVESLDLNGDGLLDLDDFTGLMEGGEEEKMKDLKEASEMYDADANVFITLNELKKMSS
ncbi:hypothetical protein V6N13_025449 [Hibiscus sabdariffa]|uniref:EF-hand domain-containing protein n=2 Tax=Hibiscus sabdariffa TaxID=183260 RepID=A0ABR2P8N5_9ROSI